METLLAGPARTRPGRVRAGPARLGQPVRDRQGHGLEIPVREGPGILVRAGLGVRDSRVSDIPERLGRVCGARKRLA